MNGYELLVWFKPPYAPFTHMLPYLHTPLFMLSAIRIPDFRKATTGTWRLSLQENLS